MYVLYKYLAFLEVIYTHFFLFGLFVSLPEVMSKSVLRISFLSFVCLVGMCCCIFLWLLDIYCMILLFSTRRLCMLLLAWVGRSGCQPKKDRSLNIMERWVVPLFTLEKLLQDLKVMLYCLYFMHLPSCVTLSGEVLDAPRK